MASVAANDVNAVVVDAGLASPERVAGAGATTRRTDARGHVAVGAVEMPVSRGDVTGRNDARPAVGDPSPVLAHAEMPRAFAVDHLDGLAAAAIAARPHVALPARSAILVRLAGLAVLCAVTLVAPALLLVWMPIVLGVPHIASDIRFLVLPLPRRQIVLAAAACASLVALKAASLAGGLSLLRIEMIVVALWLLGMLALDHGARRTHALSRHVATRSNPQPSSIVWITAAAAAMAIISLPMQFAIVAAFAHNIVAVIAWIVVKRPERRHAIAVIAVIGAAVAVLVVAGPAVAMFTGGNASPWLTVDKAASVMFGGVPLATARGLMIAFAFLQAVHYAIWLDWIPHGAQPARMPTKPWLLVTAGTLAVIAAALVDARWARTTYLALATFHIYLELVVLAARAARRRA